MIIERERDEFSWDLNAYQEDDGLIREYLKHKLAYVEIFRWFIDTYMKDYSALLKEDMNNFITELWEKILILLEFRKYQDVKIHDS